MNNWCRPQGLLTVRAVLLELIYNVVATAQPGKTVKNVEKNVKNNIYGGIILKDFGDLRRNYYGYKC